MQSSANRVNPQSRRRALTLATAGFTCVAVFLGGCSSSPVSQVGKSTKVEYYPTCYEPVQHLRDSDSNMTKSVATGAVIGAVGGALTGALVGNKDDLGRNAAIGAAGGALVGGAAGYYTEKQKQITDDHQRLGSYASDADKSAADIDRSVAYAQASQSCYQSQFSSLLQQRKAGTIKEDEGRKRLAEIVAGLKESNDLISAVNGKTGEDLNNYTQAYEKDLQTVGVKRTDVATVAQASSTTTSPTKTKTKTQTKKKLPSVPSEAVASERALRDAQAKQLKSVQVASQGTTQVNGMCKNPDIGDWAPVPCPNV
ncbi:type VI secretion system-associated lipoprotein TagQ [Pseudomonas sp. CAN2814]|uniref:type VI secretion system-associated lipoprotein TagQ n=1 Tax=Pseudomonas sp. CAN1 TaxID=3046726 RepID=UPI00264A1C39|nr:type VI secretion system-associated lipoprotein TagQ [Pseudomonas sp. CAN1]MDN6859252.1 type VI secretion system-associated lipoprotein TagQ [Pseudomonas sp. CAN1]